MESWWDCQCVCGRCWPLLVIYVDVNATIWSADVYGVCKLKPSTFRSCWFQVLFSVWFRLFFASRSLRNFPPNWERGIEFARKMKWGSLGRTWHIFYHPNCPNLVLALSSTLLTTEYFTPLFAYTLTWIGYKPTEALVCLAHKNKAFSDEQTPVHRNISRDNFASLGTS